MAQIDPPAKVASNEGLGLAALAWIARLVALCLIAVVVILPVWYEEEIISLGILDIRMVKTRLGFAFIGIILGFGLVLLAGYYAADEKRRLLAASLFSLGLLIPLLCFRLLWIG